VRANNGHIASISVPNGAINSLPGGDGIYRIRALTGIDSISAISINADITTRSDVDFGTATGRIGLLETTGGDFQGALACAYIGPATGSPSYAIRVYGSLSAIIETDHADGLAHQVIVNAGGGSGTWTGPFYLGNHLTTDKFTDRPYYATVSSDVGGSAVGLVPYHLYQTDCDPPYDADGACSFDFPVLELPASFGDGVHTTNRETYVLRHYGWVFNSSASVPYTISLQSVATGTGTRYGTLSGYTDMTSEFDVYLPSDHPREVWIAYKLDSGSPQTITTDYRYKVDLVSSGGHTLLRSGGTVAASDPDVAGYPYIFNTLCPARPEP
jgi:hypothetical protein